MKGSPSGTREEQLLLHPGDSRHLRPVGTKALHVRVSGPVWTSPGAQRTHSVGAGDRDRSRCSLGCVNQWTNSREATKDGVLVPSALALRADVRDAASSPLSGVGPAAAQRPCSWGQRTCGTPPGPRTVPRGRASPSEGWRPGLTPLLTPLPPPPTPAQVLVKGNLS